MQAVDEEADPSAEEEFGGGVLRKRAKASKQDKQADAEAAALQQVCLAASCHVPVSGYRRRFHKMCLLLYMCAASMCRASCVHWC